MPMKRPHIPIKVRLAILERQAFVERAYPSQEERDLAREWYELRYHKFTKSEKIEYLLELLFRGMPVELDHDPALILRYKNHKTGGYRPDANDPRYLVYRLKPEHRKKTIGRKPDAERLEAARIAREEQARLRKALEEAETARLAAERARKEETKAAKAAIADAEAAKAAHAKLLADIAAEKEREAKLATEISNADIVRVRGDGTNGAGVMLTSRQEGYAILVDRALIDIKALEPFFTTFEIEKALRAWAKTTGFKTQMDGAEVGFRHVGVTR